jgi:transposase
MRTGISITITRSVRGRLEAITRDRNASQKHAWRAAIILSSADGVGTNEIMRRTGKSKTCVWRWQERFMKEGIARRGPRASLRSVRRWPRAWWR